MNATVKQFFRKVTEAIDSGALTDNRTVIAYQVQELYNAHVHKLYKASPNDLWLALNSLDNTLQTANYLSTTEEEARSAAANARFFCWDKKRSD